MKYRNIILSFVILLLALPSTILSQVVVEKSKDKVIISGKPYYIHIVKKGETAYSISKAYGITVPDLTNENPAAKDGVKVNQSLKIPVAENNQKIKAPQQPVKPVKDESKFVYHKLDRGETVFALSKKYGVSEEEIVQSNIGIEINKLPLGSEIAIPRREFMNNEKNLPVPEKNIYHHKVSKGETLYSIAEKYGITVKDLRKENKGLMFPKVDDYVRIPVANVTENVVENKPRTDSLVSTVQIPAEIPEQLRTVTAVKKLSGTFDVALLLPLYFDENAIRIEIDSSRLVKGKPVLRTIEKSDEWIYPESQGFIELYTGILLAADTLRSLGLNINLHTYDITSDSVVLTKLLVSGDLKNMDLIIGPAYSNNLTMVASYANSFGIPVVSPVPLQNNTPLINNPTLFKVNPSLEVAQDAIAKRVSDFPHDNFIFIHSDSTHTNPDIDLFKNKLFRELTKKLPFDEIKFKEFIFYSRSNTDEDSINRLEHSLSDQTKNFVIIASEDPPMISECVSNLKTLSKKFDIMLMGYPAMRTLDNEDWKDYFDLGVELFSPYWIDYKNADILNFNAAYRRKFLTEPSEGSYAWEGYDMAYYFLSGLAIHGKKFITNPEIHNPDLLMTSYRFRRKANGSGFENQKLFLIKYTNDMEVKLIADPDASIK